MKIEKILDIRFLAPVGIMIFFVFLFSPGSFLVLVFCLSKASWLVSAIGLLGTGLIISSITEFCVRTLKGHLGKHGYDYKKIFRIEKDINENDKKESAQELSTWMILDVEDKRNSGHVRDQIHKRWNMAMANYNAAVASVLGSIIAVLLSMTGWLSSPQCTWVIFYIATLIFSVCIFYINGQRARYAVLDMNDLLASRNEREIFSSS